MNDHRNEKPPRIATRAAARRSGIRPHRPEPQHDTAESLATPVLPSVLARLPEIKPEPRKSPVSRIDTSRIDTSHPKIVSPPNHVTTPLSNPAAGTENLPESRPTPPMAEEAIAVATPNTSDLSNPLNTSPPIAAPHLKIASFAQSTKPTGSNGTPPSQSTSRRLKLEEANRDTEWVDWAVKITAAIVAIILLALAWKNMQRPVASSVAVPERSEAAWPSEEPARIAMRGNFLREDAGSPNPSDTSAPSETDVDWDDESGNSDRPVFLDTKSRKPIRSIAEQGTSYPSTGVDLPPLDRLDPGPAERRPGSIDPDAKYPATRFPEFPSLPANPSSDTRESVKAPATALSDPLEVDLPSVDDDSLPTPAVEVRPETRVTEPLGALPRPARLDGKIQQF